MKNKQLQIYQIVIIALFIAVILTQFFLPFASLNEKNITALEGFTKYSSLHWGFNYFIVIIILVSISFFIFLISLKNIFSKYRNYSYYLALLTIIVEFAMLIPLEDFLKNQENVVFKALMPNAVITFFLLDFIMIIGLIFYMKQQNNRKKEKKSKYNINLKTIIIFSIIVPLSGFVGVEIGLGAGIGGAIGGIIAYFILKSFKNKKGVNNTKSYI
jgi:hypothetical protein